MAMPYVISVLVVSGDPDGVRVVEKSNWTGRGVMFGRADLASALEQSLDGPGVYVLLGDDDSDDFDAQVYVGQAEDVGKRLKQHLRDQSKDFWERTLVFDSPIGALNRAHISLLESKMIELARESRRARVANGNLPSLPHLSAIDAAVAEGFLAEAKAIMPAIGVDVFDVPDTSSPETGEVAYRVSGPDAEGSGVERSDGFLVFAGALARKEATSSLSTSLARHRDRLVAAGDLVDAGDRQWRLTSDVLFKSPSTAAMVVLGRNANGRVDWKDDEGVSLKEHQIKRAGGDD